VISASCPLYPRKLPRHSQTGVSALGQKRTHAPQHDWYKKKDRLAAVSSKSDQVFWSGCDNSVALPLSAPAEQAHRAEACGEER
jgi:hypothetical protein